jgi:hypothetical protein
MKDAKYDWDYHNDGPEDGGNDIDDKHHGHIEHMVDVLFYIGNPHYDYPCGTFARDSCNYWAAKEELERRQVKDERL